MSLSPMDCRPEPTVLSTRNGQSHSGCLPLAQRLSWLSLSKPERLGYSLVHATSR